MTGSICKAEVLIELGDSTEGQGRVRDDRRCLRRSTSSGGLMPQLLLDDSYPSSSPVPASGPHVVLTWEIDLSPHIKSDIHTRNPIFLIPASLTYCKFDLVLVTQLDGWLIDKWMDEFMDTYTWMAGWLDVWMEGWIDRYAYRYAYVTIINVERS